jgi:HEPN domain-containing protein
MPIPDSLIPSEWFAKAKEDLRAAEILLTHDGPLGIVAFLVQQSVEKYLKGYLLSTGWSFERVHDLETLIGEASARDAEFAPFLGACQRITEYYIEGRYPIGLASALTRDEITTSLEDARQLARLVREKAVATSGSEPGGNSPRSPSSSK